MEQSNFRLNGYTITNASYKLNGEVPNHTENLQQKIQVSVIVAEDNARIADVRLDVDLRTGSNTLEFGARIVGNFEASSEMDDATFNSMCNINAPAILYPVIRAFVSSLSAQAGIPTIILPLLNFQQVKAKGKSSTHK